MRTFSTQISQLVYGLIVFVSEGDMFEPGQFECEIDGSDGEFTAAVIIVYPWCCSLLGNLSQYFCLGFQ